ncbi:endonuclease/exonuclease/phosphatase family protein [Bdellovibrio sp. HCB337]|uniref:endonuclease/exonuclease/phosphatase family protein n=1 Tax=Bdellovibrio sp. HCB337 TaxID=3394358 RepID=UPI0039A7272B
MERALLAVLLILGIQSMAQAFSIGTQNLYHYRTAYETRVEHLYKEHAKGDFPEILGVQEAARWSLSENIFDELIRLTNYRGIYQNTNEFGVMNEGLALVAGVPGRNLESRELPATKMFSRQYMNAGVFLTDSGEIMVINVHFSPFAEMRQNRVVQAKFVMKFIAEKSEGLPVVIVGDLNDSYDSSVLQVFRDAGFADALDGKEYTYNPDTNPLVKDKQYGPSRLDYILYQPARLKVEKANLIFQENWVSDHYGLGAVFSLIL